MMKTKQAPQELLLYLKLSDGVIITDENHIILEVNAQYEQITGFVRESIIGLKAGFLKSNHTPLATYQQLKENLAQGIPWSGVLINRKKSGVLWHSSISITPVQVNETLFFIGVFRELEQLKQGVYISEDQRVETQRELLKVLAISCEIRDPGIEDHLIRVQDLTKQLVEVYQKENSYKLAETYVHNIIHCSILHDIGKAGIPEGILYKPGSLTTFERKIIEMHPLMGNDILKKISTNINHELITSLEVAENIIMYHHEKWNGTGYPNGLKEEEIPFEARLVSIVDVYDALTSRRSYKEAWSVQRAISYLNEQKGIQFDPGLVDLFSELIFNDE
ncbi:putative two-component system response regulator [Bacillus mesophilus]|uniref:HD domain-containing protein n=1 Tax=Bacillus mesophilus TaxID=1808955 RepID=A0A6M0Q303_9BACI|nr:HD domain-containing phosphohydrolase [Bacillus mesophilus]MBM7659906.1 putative two-component system response regulator [Bacillus mesophilus]NEY70765.1 HD domain-containing protein [Bacillus mesophilus]